MSGELQPNSDVISVVANRYSAHEIELALWFLVGCFVLCLLAFVISAWIKAKDNSSWSVLVKPISYNKKGRTQVRDCRTFDAYGTKGRTSRWYKRLWRWFRKRRK